MAELRVFILEDDPLVASTLAAALAEEPELDAIVVPTASHVLGKMDDEAPDAVICGLKLGASDGLALLAEFAARDPDLVGLVMTSMTDEDGAARAIAALGPLRHVRKPCDMADLLPKLRAGLERRALARALQTTRTELAGKDAQLAESARRAARAAAELASKHTALTTATERLVQAEQLAAVGRVVTGIAHELSRQLALVGYAEAIKSQVAGNTELCELADVIVNAQKRLSAMVDEIRDFVAAEVGEGAASRLDREPADVAAVVDEALAIMRYDRDVCQRTIIRDYRARPLCALHHHKFAQVIINLVSNAVLASEPGATIRVELDELGKGAEAPSLREAGLAGPVALIAVSDSGSGMPPEVLARLGEPFFTTRGDRGSGLGVGICMRIVEEHGGKLVFASEVGRGTIARVFIPLLAGPDSGPGGADKQADGSGQKPSAWDAM